MPPSWLIDELRKTVEGPAPAGPQHRQCHRLAHDCGRRRRNVQSDRLRVGKRSLPAGETHAGHFLLQNQFNHRHFASGLRQNDRQFQRQSIFWR